MNYCDGHDVKNAAGVGIFGVGEFVIPPAILINGLNLAVDLAAIWPFKINAIFPMRGDGVANNRIGGFFLRHLSDVEGLLVGDVKLGAESP